MTVESHLKARLLWAIKLDQESTRKLLHGALLIIRPLTSKLSWRMNQKFSSQLAARLITEKITWMMEVNFSFFVFGNLEKKLKTVFGFLKSQISCKATNWQEESSESVFECVCSVSEERRKWRRSKDRLFLMQGCSEQQWGSRDFDSNH